jgi:hypothetical protein
MIVEPVAGDRLEDNLNPVGRLYYAAATLICIPLGLGGKPPSAERALNKSHHFCSDTKHHNFRPMSIDREKSKELDDVAFALWTRPRCVSKQSRTADLACPLILARRRVACL